MTAEDRNDKAIPRGLNVPVGQAIELAGLVEYSGGSIVSRTMLDTSAATMTLFAFDAGQRLSEHTTPFDAAVQILDGSAQVSVGGRRIPASAGQLVVMPANVPHAVEAPQRFKMLLTMIKSGSAETHTC